MFRSKHNAAKVKDTDHFDYGHNVEKELKLPSEETMDAIIKNLKGIPRILSKENAKLISIPFKGIDNLNLTDDVEKEDSKTFNPIAFYGYLIGRTINRQSKNKVYTNYRLSMPIEFEDYKKDAIRESIKYGISRSLPSMMRHKLQVTSNYDEPVALLGVATELGYLTPKNDSTLSPFAVFDFGGGTLDFAFGIFREVLDDDDEVAIKGIDTDENDTVIEIFKTGGRLLGGETLIDSISYEIYKQNKEIMIKNNISILVPDGEDIIPDLPDKLTGTRHVDRTNLRMINETISRDIFIKGINNTPKQQIKLFSIIDSKLMDIELQVDGTKIRQMLEQKIQSAVSQFKAALTDAFHSESGKSRMNKLEFNLDDLKHDIRIILAGNTCKSSLVKKAFNSSFNDFIDNEQTNGSSSDPSGTKKGEQLNSRFIFLENKDKNITAKNAVARGVLKLDNVGVHRLSGNSSFTFTIYAKNPMGGAPIKVLTNGANSDLDWTSFAGLDKQTNSFKLYYSKVSNLMSLDADEMLYKTVDVPKEVLEMNGKRVYIKAFNSNTVEFTLGKRKGISKDGIKSAKVEL
jgi:hypothetical protein